MGFVVTALRLIPLPIHAALELAIGLFTMAAPFLLGFGLPAAVVAVAIGALITGVALAGTVDERGSSAVPVSALHAFDYGIAVGLMGAAAVVGLAGDPPAALGLALIGGAQLLLNLTTRYSLRA
jgi:hypothetical protein